MTSTHPHGRPAMLHPWLDVLLSGGGSILVLGGLLAIRPDLLTGVAFSSLAIWNVVFNMPHFMASYRIVYRSKEMILRHWVATLVVPAVLILYGLFAVSRAGTEPHWFGLLWAVAGMYLAWHYTGQAWGMVASYAHLQGIRITRRERLMIRTSLRIMLAWHVTWFAHFDDNNPWLSDMIGRFYEWMTPLSLFSLLLGAAGFGAMASRTRRMPHLAGLSAWLAIYVWYAVMAVDRNTIHLVQIAHAVQYLVFPLRVEINRTPASPAALRPWRILAYFALLVFAGFAVDEWISILGQGWVEQAWGTEAANRLPIFVLAFINIHHYFTDGCIWKISSDTVKRDLFAHLEAPSSPKPQAC